MSNENEIKKIIKESISEFMAEKSIPKKNRLVDVLGVILTPIVIAAVSLFVTYKINKAQEFNAKMIAKSQIESAKSIAAAQREHNERIANAELEVQRLNQIDEIFHAVIKNGSDSPDPATKKMLIGSLTVHRETSLPFLVRIRDYFAPYEGDLRALSDHASDTIAAVLANKHLDFKNMNFSAKGELRILRYAKLQDYNLNGVVFDDCNLFKAKFTRSSLTKASFRNADLFGADFSETKLDGAEFDGANLRKAIFTDSKIDGANFEKAVNLEDARFSLSALLKDYEDQNPFEKVKNDTVLELLVPHVEELKEVGSENRELKKFLKRFEEIITYDRLIANLEERRAQRLASKNLELALELTSDQS
jgi:hypothetical protein